MRPGSTLPPSLQGLLGYSNSFDFLSSEVSSLSHLPACCPSRPWCATCQTGALTGSRISLAQAMPNNGASSQWLPGNRDPSQGREPDEGGLQPAKADLKRDDNYSETRPLHARASLYPWVSRGLDGGLWGEGEGRERPETRAQGQSWSPGRGLRPQG